MKENNHDKDQKLLDILNQKVSDAEKRELAKEKGFESYIKVLEEVDQWQLPTLDIDHSYNKLKSKRTKTINVNWYQSTAFRVAAGVALIFALALFFISRNADEITYETSIASYEEIWLPDSSYVYLGPGSTLSFRKKEWDKRRKLKLSGNAYFDVTKGSPFSVNFGEAQVDVLGTQFDIREGEDISTVSCYEGSVRVSNSDQNIILKPGNEAALSDRNISSSEFPLRKWNKELVRFNSAPLSEVFAALKKDYDITINTGKIDLTRRFTGAYIKNDLDRALKMVCIPMNIEYEINGKSVDLL